MRKMPQTRRMAAQTVCHFSHNADFCRLRISKYPANAQEMKYFFTLVIDWNGFGEIIIRWKRGKK